MFVTPYVVHLVVSNGPAAAPLCGEWTRSINWTTLPDAATCPECCERLRAATAAVEGDQSQQHAPRP